MNDNTFDFEGKFNEEYRNLRARLKKPNILVCGGTGAGKSTLIQQTISDPSLKAKIKAGAGKPITQNIEVYEGDLLRIHDSPGYEAGSDKQAIYKDKVLALVLENEHSPEDRIHMVWYCISLGNHRIFDIDISTIRDIENARVPIAVVLTQADKASEQDANAMQEELRRTFKSIAIFETSIDKTVNLSVQPLLEWSSDNIGPAMRTAFVSGTNISIEKKAEQGRQIVLHHITAATAIAAAPIPLSDAPLLLANQATLVARLGSLWDLPTLSAITKGVMASTAVSTAGKTLAGTLLKATGVGAIVGGLINSAVAATITAGIGYGVNEMLAMMARDELAGKKADISYYLEQLPELINIFKSKSNEAIETVA